MLREAVASVLTQTWASLEIIIVDDGSTDDTRNVAAELRAHHPEIIRVLHQENAGAGVARQTGFEASSGEFIQFLDSDDRLLPNKLELQVRGLRGDTEAGISYGKTYVRAMDGQRLHEWLKGEKHREIFPRLLTGRLWYTSTPLYRRTALEKIGPWSARKWLEDYEFDGRAGAARIKLNYCDEYICQIVEHNRPRASGLQTRPDVMRDGISAYLAVLRHAQRAGIARSSREMQEFAGSLFEVARYVGRYGLHREAKELFGLALRLHLKPRWDYRAFGIATSVLGWKAPIRIARFAKNLTSWSSRIYSLRPD
jgi:glycosyltransferase involved in cell wall biosynthesis